MKNMQGESHPLRHVPEHVNCKNYVADDRTILRIEDLKKDGCLVLKGLKHSSLFFVLEGEIALTAGRRMNGTVGSGSLFFIPSGDNCCCRAQTDTSLLHCSIDRSVLLCANFTFRHLAACTGRQDSMHPVILPVTGILRRELQATEEAIRSGMLCFHYQRIKADTLLLILRGFYRKEDLAALFAPVLGDNPDFKALVMGIHRQARNVNDLIGLSGLPPTSFKRKFLATFGMSAGKWMTAKKEEDILNDILMTDLSFSEIAGKHYLTPNYLTRFCKEHFRKTPTELRQCNK